MENIMNENIIERLFLSFVELERAIESARTTLSTKTSVPTEVLERLNSYTNILANQRRMASELARHFREGNSAEVARHVTIINGLSGMIIEDARAILTSLTQDQALGEPED